MTNPSRPTPPLPHPAQLTFATPPLASAHMKIVPANEASFEDLQTVFGTRGAAANCQCQRYKLRPREAFAKFPAAERARRLQHQTHAGDRTTGLVAFLDGEPVGWCAVEPRTAYEGLLRNNRVPWEGRSEDKADETVWAVTCVFVRAGFRRRGIAHALARAAVEHARASGARALEAYPMLPQKITTDEIHVGSRSIFAAAGFAEVSRPTLRRVVMRVDFLANVRAMIESGTKAPDFTLPDQDGNDVSLQRLRRADRRPLLLSQGRHARLHDAGVRDPRPRGRLRRRRRARDRRLARPRQAGQEVPRRPVAQLHAARRRGPRGLRPYGTWVEKRCTARSTGAPSASTFIIDGDGTVVHVIQKASPKTHDDEVLGVLAAA